MASSRSLPFPGASPPENERNRPEGSGPAGDPARSLQPLFPGSVRPHFIGSRKSLPSTAFVNSRNSPLQNASGNAWEKPPSAGPRPLLPRARSSSLHPTSRPLHRTPSPSVPGSPLPRPAPCKPTPWRRHAHADLTQARVGEACQCDVAVSLGHV